MLCPPTAALLLIPVLLTEIAGHWPTLPLRSVLGGQVEQESRWNPRAELKTSREQGFGLAQFTRTDRFDTQAELRARYARELAGWTWDGRFDARYQLRALVLYDRELYGRCAPLMGSARDGLACMASSYNGGFGGFARDRTLCANTAGCDRTRWDGNVERTSYKARTAAAGYGKSFFEVNREYVRNVLDVRRPKYVRVMDKGLACT